jgi:hypothetical protein
MEPISNTAISIGLIIVKKALEKIGDKVGDALTNKVEKFLALLKEKSPTSITVIEKASENSFDINKAISELELAVKSNPEINQAMEDVVTAAKKDTNPNIVEIVNMPNLQKLSDKIVNYAAGDINIETQNITI